MSFWDEDAYSADGALNNEEEIQSFGLDEISPEDAEAIEQESPYKLSQQDVSVVYNARYRLELAKLYEMLINHNLFEGVQADDRAIEQVQSELKQYIIYRLEVLMGIRKQEKKPQLQENSSSLNEVEIDFLKQLAYKGTKGASLTTKVEQKPEPVKPSPVVNKIKPMVMPEAQKAPKKEIPQQPVVKQEAKPQPKPQESQDVARIAKQLGISQKMAALALKDIQENEGRKDVNEMSEEEMARVVKEQGVSRQKPSRKSLPMPSIEMANAGAIAFANEVVSKNSGLQNIIVNTLKNGGNNG